MKFRLLLLLLLFFALQGFAQSAPAHPEMLVSTQWLAEHLDDPKLVILCVSGDPEFYSKGHIPSARRIAFDQLVTQGTTLNANPSVEQLEKVFERAGVEKDSHIVIYGEKQGMLAARAYLTLDYLQLAEHAALLDGGIEKWRSESRPETRDVPEVRPSALKLRANPEVLVSFEQMRDHVQRGDATLIDARTAAEYSGEKRSEDVPRSGHIPGAKGLYWMNLVKSKEESTLRPPGELREAFRLAGAIPGRKVVTYCRTGVQASFDYFVAKYLGFPAKVYLASFYEWSRQDVPVEESVLPAVEPQK